jgi:hypothetical protein
VHNYSTTWGLIGQIGSLCGIGAAGNGLLKLLAHLGNRQSADPGTTLELIDREAAGAQVPASRVKQ